MTRIEIIAIDKDKIYSVGYVTISKDGGVFLILKAGGSDMHISRHASGSLHWKSETCNFKQEIRKGVPIEAFEGIEFIGGSAFGLNSLPELFTEYKLKKCNGIFAIDMREYKDAAFNMSLAILTKEGLPILYDSWQKMKKRQIYLFTDSHPMIAITVAYAKSITEL
jgi:hypothetical protein